MTWIKQAVDMQSNMWREHREANLSKRSREQDAQLPQGVGKRMIEVLWIYLQQN